MATSDLSSGAVVHQATPVPSCATPNPFDHLIDQLETSLKSLIAIYNTDIIENKTAQETLKKTVSAEQTKTNIENSVNDLYEKATNLETMFLKCRLDLSRNLPDQLIKEEIDCLKAELKRKDDLLRDTRDKLATCEAELTTFAHSLDASS